MNDEFSNRLTAFQTTRDTIFSAQWRPVWEGKPPLIFGTRAEEMKTALAKLEDFCRRHGVVITGAAEDKDREETELEDAAFLNAKALVEFYKAAANLTEAAKYDFPITRWRQLRDSELLAEAKSVRLAMEALAADAATSAEAAQYDLTAAAAAALEKERADYEKLVTAPAQAAKGRKGLTGQLRAEFAKVGKFESLDNLVGKFGTTPEGRDFVATYKAARIIRDAGGRASGGTAGGSTPPAAPSK